MNRYEFTSIVYDELALDPDNRRANRIIDAADEYADKYADEYADEYAESMAPKWIPVKAHKATEEERESRPDIDYWFDCEMPDDEQEILVTVKHTNWLGVEKDVCYVEDSYGLDSGKDWLDDVIAWMPLPEPYQAERGEEDDT